MDATSCTLSQSQSFEVSEEVGNILTKWYFKSQQEETHMPEKWAAEYFFSYENFRSLWRQKNICFLQFKVVF